MSSLLDLDSEPRRAPATLLAALGRAVTGALASASSTDALRELAAAARTVSGADVAVIRALDESGRRLEAVAVVASPALAAELEGTSILANELPARPVEGLEQAPVAVRRAADRAGATRVLLVPARLDGCAVSLELFADSDPFTSEQQLAAELCAAQAALVLRAFSAGRPAGALALPGIQLAGEALVAALHERDAAAEVAGVAARVADAAAAILWEDRAGTLVLAASCGLDATADVLAARELAERALSDPWPVRTHAAERLTEGCGASTTLPLGRPPFGVLQLLHRAGEEPDAAQLSRLATFGVRAAHALRAGERARSLALELERTRALHEVIAQATAELSVSHTLETAVGRVAELLGTDRVAVYLRGEGELEEAAGRGLAGPHARVADRLLDLALGPARDGAVLEIVDVSHDARLDSVQAAARETGIGAVLAVPLVAGGEVLGLLAAYPRGRLAARSNETALLAALAGQLAVAIQNAQLHEETTRLGEEREAALRAERAAARRLRALYEVSSSFAQTLSLDETVDALSRTVVDVLDVDAAVVHMPDERRELLLPLALHVGGAQIEEPIRAVLLRAQPYGQRNVQRLFRDRRGFRLTPSSTAANDFLPLLAPFLETGWTAAVVPVALPGEVLASLGIFSFRPGNPLSDETIEAAAAIARQAALAIDNARLYQQQKQFADTMQRSLLPRSRPVVVGLEVGEVYEPSSRVEVGGDVYDFLALDDGRLAVVLGDVTGHGVAATADMAMAKFVFRSLAREQPEPAAFLAAANDVICSEIASGKFISMSYVVVDGIHGSVAAASAGHPSPRLLLPDGTTAALDTSGLVLGIDPGQEYAEARVELPRGASLVLYTDGVVEARSNGELYGGERLAGFLGARCELSPRELAAAVAQDAREFAGGELYDDLAVVVIRRT